MTSSEADACSYCDEEPPGTTSQFIAPRLRAPVSRVKRRRVLADRDPFSPGGFSGRHPRTTFQTRAFRKTFYPDVTDKEWNSWHWQARNRIRTLAQLEQVLVLGGRRAGSPFPGEIHAPGEHYAILHEPGFPRRPEPALAQDRDPFHARSSIKPRARPTIRWAKKPTAPCRAWCTGIRTGFCCW